MTDYYVPGTEETDPKKTIMSLQQAHEKTATNTTNIATNTANITTNTTNIAANTAAIAAIVPGVAATPITNSLAADVALSNTANYFVGPTIAQGSTGTWWVSGTVTVQDTIGAAGFDAKLWDGTTVIASTDLNTSGATFGSMSLSGYIVSPAGNLRIEVKDLSSTSGKIIFSRTGLSKDSTISAHRIA